MSALPSKKDRPALRRAGRLAAVWGWSYILTLIAFFFLSDVKDVPSVYHWVLFTSILFVLVGLTELYWRHRLLHTGQARWVRVLALNEFAGTLALFWCAGWLYKLDIHGLEKLISPEDLRQVSAITGQPVTPEMLDFGMNFAKTVTAFGVGGLLFLSQVWVIYQYLRLAPIIEREAALPPILK